jgi:hypothetical protein
MNLNSLAGLIDYWTRHHRKFFPWGFAMNGQTSRLETTRQIIYALDIMQIVETGTFRGTTTEWFAQFGLPVESVEAHPRYHAFSAARLRKKANVKLYLDSSVAFLKDRVGRTIRDTRQLFYLDAHWENCLPLREELESIFENYRNAIVVIDDFNVEDDPGYGFDSYGPEKTLNLDLLRRCNVPPMFIFYPATRSDQETGMRRGWAVITTNAEMARKLKSIVLLRPPKGLTPTGERPVETQAAS